jgi:hypothetical protein
VQTRVIRLLERSRRFGPLISFDPKVFCLNLIMASNEGLIYVYITNAQIVEHIPSFLKILVCTYLMLIIMWVFANTHYIYNIEFIFCLASRTFCFFFFFCFSLSLHVNKALITSFCTRCTLFACLHVESRYVHTVAFLFMCHWKYAPIGSAVYRIRMFAQSGIFLCYLFCLSLFCTYSFGNLSPVLDSNESVTWEFSHIWSWVRLTVSFFILFFL